MNARRTWPVVILLVLAAAIAVGVSMSERRAPSAPEEAASPTPTSAAASARRRTAAVESAEAPRRRWAEDADAPPPSPPGEPPHPPRISERRRVEIAVVDGSTGAALPGVVVRRGDRDGPSAADAPLSVGADDKAEAAFHLEPPDGFGGVETITWHGPVASRATSVRFTFAVFPLGDVAVQFVDEAGAPVAGVKELHATARDRWNGRAESVTLRASPSDADGATTLRLPRIPFHDFALNATKRLTPGPEGVILPGDEDEPDPEDAHWLSSTFVVKPSDFGGPRRTIVLARRRPRGGLGQGGGGGSSCGPDHEPEGPQALLVVRLVHSDDKPAARVTVRLDDGSYRNAITDDEGVARFEALTKGDRRFMAAAHGFRPTPFHAQVGRDAEVVVKETAARTVEVIVTDAEDHRLPAACVTVRCASVIGPDRKETYVGGWCTVAQLDGETEIATPLTGADGTVRLQEPAGEIEYRAHLGGAMVEVKSAADVVRIVLKKD